ncbi:MAG TPA: hypothetical protein VGV69_04260 [Solirubrobacterales bacterium]|nr:hypothetical protein [Solirubrobacterales bacterium]
MARLSALLIAFALGAAAAVSLVACGSGDEADLLPGTTAEQIESNLDQVEVLVAEEDCIGAEDAVAEVAAEVEGLRGVDLKLKAALEEGTDRLSEVVGRCEEEDDGEEEESTLEADVEAEEVEEDDEKPKKVKPDSDEEEPAESTEEPEVEEGPELPAPSNGKGEEKGGGEGAPPVDQEAEEAPSSGGVSPGVGVE